MSANLRTALIFAAWWLIIGGVWSLAKHETAAQFFARMAFTGGINVVVVLWIMRSRKVRR
jgi:hypothetical protein